MARLQTCKVIEPLKNKVTGNRTNQRLKKTVFENGYNHIKFLFVFIALTCISHFAFPQAQDSLFSFSLLKKMSLEELMNIEVTSVSMRPEKLTEVASAIQVLTGEDIHRSGIIRLPEALRLAPNLQVAQANSHDWSITSRGFSGLPTTGGLLSNKLLAMIDGRSVYSPLFGGVYWDVQNIMLEDVDRIEVVSGPGGTLWGANAVNGVINIKTKSADKTQGVYVSQIAGTSSFFQDHTEMRYGSKVGENIYFRIYGQQLEMKRENTSDTINRYNMKQGGFRMDYYPSASSTITLQGDFYTGTEKNILSRTLVTGQNLLGRFTHVFSEASDLTVKLFTDHTTRNTPNARSPLYYEVYTHDVEIQYRFPAGKRQSILMGGGYRYMYDITNTPSLNPRNRSMPLASGFIQDEIAWIPDLLKVTIGSKFLHNVFTGFEIQPSARVAVTPNKQNTLWTSVSRAVRMPARFDADVVTSQGISFAPEGFKSENVIAYELGYRVRPKDNISFSFATFYNQYTHLRSLNAYSSTVTPVIIANNQRAESWGFEFSENYQATEWWRLRGGYSYFKKKIVATSSAVLALSADFEGVDPEHQVILQSIMDLPKNISLDFTGRYVDMLRSTPPIPATPSYFSCDVRLAWQFKNLEISAVGQNILENEHYETGLYTIPRSIYGRVVCRI